MTYCKKCGGVIMDGDKFCSLCGEPVLQTAEAPIMQTAASTESEPPSKLNAVSLSKNAPESNDTQISESKSALQPDFGQQPGQAQFQQNFTQQPGQAQFQQNFTQQPEQAQFQQSFTQQPGQPQFQQNFTQQPGQAQFQQNFTQQPGQAQFQQNFTQQPGQPQYNQYQPYHTYAQPPKKKSYTGLIIGMVLGGLALAALCIVFLFCLVNFSSDEAYERPLNDFCDGLNDHDIDTFCNAFPDEFADSLKLMYEYDEEALFSDMGFEHTRNVEIEVLNAEELSGHDLDYYLEYGFSSYIADAEFTCKEGYYLDITLSYYEYSAPYEETGYMVVGKVDGKWAILDFN